MTTSKYKHLFFDLDHTLWDFEANSLETLTELYAELEMEKAGIPSFRKFQMSCHFCQTSPGPIHVFVVHLL